jgi:hypothetical protein
MPAVKKKAASKKPAKPCDCVAKANARLAPEGLEIDDRMVMSFGEGTASGGIESPLVRLRWTNDKRKKPTPPMFCAYCPFCGRKKS